MHGPDREFDRMITSEPFDYRHKFVRLHQVLGMLGLPLCFFWVYQLHLIWQLLAWTGVLLVLTSKSRIFAL